MRQSEFDLLQPRLNRFVRANFGRLPGHDLEDVCQQAWETLWRHRDVEGKPVSNAFPFLCQAARWGALALMRAGRRCQPVPDIPDGPGPIEATPEATVDRLISQRQLEEFIDDMPPAERGLAQMVIEGCDLETVEEKIGLTGAELLELWDRTRSLLLDRALKEKGNPVRRALLDANGDGRLKSEMRIRLDRAAANDPTLCLELAASL